MKVFLRNKKRDVNEDGFFFFHRTISSIEDDSEKSGSGKLALTISFRVTENSSLCVTGMEGGLCCVTTHRCTMLILFLLLSNTKLRMVNF